MSLESASEFVSKLRFMDKLMESLSNADKEERERIIREAGFDFTIDELKQALQQYDEAVLAAVSGGSQCPCVVSGSSSPFCKQQHRCVFKGGKGC